MAAELLQTLLQFHPDEVKDKPNAYYNHSVCTFIRRVANISPELYLKGADGPQDVLKLLNPSVNTIAFIYALLSRISLVAGQGGQIAEAQLRPGGFLWNSTVLLLEVADPVQLRYVGTQWRKLLDHVVMMARFGGTPALAISPIRSALFRLDPTTGTFTTVHLNFIQLCMETRSYAAAIPVLDNYIHSLPSNTTKTVTELESSLPSAEHTSSSEYITTQSGHSDKITVSSVQRYYLLGAGAYIGVHEYKKARNFLEHVMVVPNSSASGGNFAAGLMVEAYQKWQILNLLVDGEPEVMPRGVSLAAAKHVRSVTKPYEGLADAFLVFNKPAKLKAEIDVGRQVWEKDGNTGLVDQLVEYQRRFSISRLARTYSAIPVSNIATKMESSVEELTEYLQTLIRDGYLNAELDQRSRPDLGVVLRFFQDPTKGPLAKTETQQQLALIAQTQRTNALAEHVKHADYVLSLTKEHVQYKRRQSQKNTYPAATGGEAMDINWEDGLVEEDIMAQ